MKKNLTYYKGLAIKQWKIAIKARALYTCEIDSCKSAAPDYQMHPHHFFTVSIASTCCDLDNGFCLCAYHHNFCKEISGHGNPDAFRDWAIGNRGIEWYTKLKERSKIIVHYKSSDYINFTAGIKQKIKEMNEQII